MSLIVGCLFVLLGGMSGTFSNNGEPNRLGSEQHETTAGPEPVAIAGQESVADKLLRLGIFAVTVVVFMGYSIFFVTRSEAVMDSEESARARADGKSKPSPDSTRESAPENDRTGIGALLRRTGALTEGERLTVSQFMTNTPLTADANDDPAEMLDKMVSRGIHHLIVVDNGQLGGIIRDQDLIHVGERSVRDFMLKNPPHVQPSTPLSIAITLLLQHRLSALPVLQSGEVVGILTHSDLLVTMQRWIVTAESKAYV